MKRLSQLLVLILVGWMVFRTLSKPPLLDGVEFSRVITDRHGVWLRVSTTRDGKFRLFAPLKSIQPALVEAALLYEDRHFYEHAGANPVALAKALGSKLTGGRRFGASTLTMQVARLRYGLKTRTIPGKLEQIWAALRIEAHYSKDQILEAYFNLAPYGGNVEGIETASRYFLGKSASELTRSECLTLAIVPQSPNRRRLDRPQIASLDHARNILSALWQERHPEDAGFLATLTTPRAARAALPRLEHAPHLTTELLNQNGPNMTTLDLALQQSLEVTLSDWWHEQRLQGVANACALLVHGPTAEVRASVGSVDFSDSRFLGQNDGTRMCRSPVATLKPFIYGLAMDAGLIHPHSLLNDAPTGFGEYNPENYDRDFAGPIQATDALIRSRNLPAVQLLDQLHTHTGLYSLLQIASNNTLKPESHYGLTLALGGCELSPRSLAKLYTLLASGGTLQDLKFLISNSKPVPAARFLSPESCFLVLDMLRQNPRPLSCGRESGGPVAWKTGTSWSYKDAWCAGVFDDYVLVVWVGDFTGKSNPTYVGRKTAAPLFFRCVDQVRALQPSKLLIPNESRLRLSRVPLCALSGDLCGPHCPHNVPGWFIPGKSPIKKCSIHQLILVDPFTHQRIPECQATASTIRSVMEVWTPEQRQLLARAGRCPPETPEWSDGNTPPSEPPPKILTPSRSLIIAGEEGVPLRARANEPRQLLQWFAGNTYLGCTPSGETLLWKPARGTYQLTVTSGMIATSREIIIR